MRYIGSKYLPEEGVPTLHSSGVKVPPCAVAVCVLDGSEKRPAWERGWTKGVWMEWGKGKSKILTQTQTLRQLCHQTHQPPCAVPRVFLSGHGMVCRHQSNRLNGSDMGEVEYRAQREGRLACLRRYVSVQFGVVRPTDLAYNTSRLLRYMAAY